MRLAYGVALAQGLDVQESQGLVALEELEGGYVTWKLESDELAPSPWGRGLVV